jgi:hypothetical protein
MLNQWKKSVGGQWLRERLASACEKWESEVKNVDTNLGTAAAKFDAGLASLAVLQRQRRQHQQHNEVRDRVGMGSYEGVSWAGQNRGRSNDQEWWAFWEVESDYRGAHRTMDMWNTLPSRQAILVLDSKGSAGHLLSDYPVKHEFLGFSHCKLLIYLQILFCITEFLPRSRSPRYTRWTRNHANSTSWALPLDVLPAVLITTIHGCRTHNLCPWPCLWIYFWGLLRSRV